MKNSDHNSKLLQVSKKLYIWNYIKEEDPYELAERLRNALTYLDEESDAEPPDQQNSTMPIPPSVGILIRDKSVYLFIFTIISIFYLQFH
jgi:hypothetical protein